MRTAIKQLLLVAAITLGVYISSSRFEFIRYDDGDYVLMNTHMRAGLTPANVRWALTSRGYADNWHPLAWTSLMFDVSVDRLLRGGKVAPDEEWLNYGNRLSNIMHFHNAVIHALNALLLMIVLWLMCQGRLSWVWPMIFALFWSLHPLRVEVVCWVAERKELVSVFYLLLTLILYLLQDKKRWLYPLALAAFAAALMGKPVAVSLPAVLLAWDWVIKGKPRILRLLPFVLLSALTCVFTVQSQNDAINIGTQIQSVTRLMAIFTAPVVYLRQTFWPADLSLYYLISHQLDNVLMSLGVVLLVLIIAIGVCWLRFRTRLLAIGAFAIAWLYVGLIPMLGIVKVGPQEHADRYTYWIGCGLSVVFVLLIDYIKPFRARILERLGSDPIREPWSELRKYIIICCAGICAAYGLVTLNRVPLWRDTETLFRDSVTKGWNCEAARILAEILRAKGKEGAAEGEQWLYECLARNPCEGSCLRLAVYLMQKPRDAALDFLGEFPYATEERLLKEVLKINPQNEEAKKYLDLIDDYRKKHEK